MRNRRWLLSLVLAGSMAVAGSGASAQDTLKVAIGQLGLWAVDAPRLGQRAGIFKKYGLVLDIFGTSGGGDTLQAVISGSADLTVGIGTAARLFQGRAHPRDRGEFYRGRGSLLVRAGGFAHQAPHGCQRQDDHRLFGERIFQS